MLPLERVPGHCRASPINSFSRSVSGPTIPNEAPMSRAAAPTASGYSRTIDSSRSRPDLNVWPRLGDRASRRAFVHAERRYSGERPDTPRKLPLDGSRRSSSHGDAMRRY